METDREDCEDDNNDSGGDDDNDNDGDEYGDDDDIDDDGYDDCFATMSISQSGIDKQQNHAHENSKVLLGILSSPVNLCSPMRGLRTHNVIVTVVVFRRRCTNAVVFGGVFAGDRSIRNT